MSQQHAQSLQDAATHALEYALHKGADAVVVQASDSRGLSVDVRNGELETLTHERDLSISLSVLKQNREGSAHICDHSHAAIEAAAEAALSAATFTEADPDQRLPDPAQYAHIDPQQQALLDVYDVEIEAISHTELLTQAQTCEASARADARIVNSNGASASYTLTESIYLTSNGFQHSRRSSVCGRSVSVLAGSEHGQQSDYAYSSARHYRDLSDSHSLGQEAAARAIAALNPRQIISGQYPILFRHDIAKSLFSSVLNALGGHAQYRGLSYLHQALGKRIMPDWLSMDEQPHLPRGMYSRWCDSDGLPTQSTPIIDAGSVARYLLSLYSARRLQLEPTGNGGGVRHARLIAPEQHCYTFEQLLQHMHTGVLVTGLMGQGVNLLTGDYSRGAHGFWVEHGNIVHPVEGITIAGNLRDMFNHIVAIGTDTDCRGRIHTPSILVEGMTVAAR